MSPWNGVCTSPQKMRLSTPHSLSTPYLSIQAIGTLHILHSLWSNLPELIIELFKCLFCIRSKGHYKRWVAEHPNAIMFTIPDCNIESYFTAHGIKYVLAHPIAFTEYELIAKSYGDKIARRSRTSRLLASNSIAFSEKVVADVQIQAYI